MSNLLPVGLFNKKKLSVLAASALVCTLAFPLITPLAQADALPQLTQLIKDNRDAVVHISVEIDNQAASNAATESFSLPDGQELPKELEKFFRNMPRGTPQPHDTQAMGSGFIISQDGYVVTNNHVVENASKIKVTLNDKRELTAKVIGKDKYSDIALLKVEATGLPTVRLGDSDGLEVGQWVVAIGAPFGLDHSATQGIVSALSRSLPDGTYVPFIQTDVAVNPGNSGGPLFDLNGNVVGVNSQIYSRSGGYMGISFAIPVNLVKNITEQLKTAGVVNRGWLGVQIQNLDQELANSFSMAKPQGALVASVQPASPADKAGVQAGDIIVGFNNTEVNSADHLPLLVGTTGIGSTVPLKVLRAGAEKTLNVTIEKLADKNAGETQELAQNSTAGTGALGLAVAGLTDQERKEANIGTDGVVVREVRADSPASRAGLEAGDVIISVNNAGIKSPEELKSIVDKAPTDKPLAMLIQRDDQKRFIAVGRS
ncbi:DegQ family serine endoprotease [uncultured Thiothrix sp.]|uniref:DegQ family serine endoprotease n=1 Tax=uncultured Thiothrix sp. TaxID=223185 RepID=UPI00262DE954|nr:DegQ family serine endoprotease [uncultured Thiothrix sp.]